MRDRRREITALERTIKIMIRSVSALAIIALAFYWWATCNRIDKKFAANCITERGLQFEGVISNYSTDSFAARSSFLINDTLKVSIPRNYKEIPLHDGDTITKLPGQNVYTVTWKSPWKDINGAMGARFEFTCADTK